MGVRGLQSFLKNNPSLADRIDISNTSIVIDGNNLSCQIYVQLCTNPDYELHQLRCDIYNGDLVAYATQVKRFIEALDKCNITPVIVMDGSVSGKQSTKDQVVLKEATLYKRGFEKFRSVEMTTEQRPTESLFLPHLLSHTFRNIAHDHGLQVIQAPYEADPHIAKIANDLNCPVLTNDSDFIIFNLPRGFIMLDQFNYHHLHKRGENLSITCNMYSQRKLAQNLNNLRSEVMPLLSVLLGNDYVETGTFDRLVNFIADQSHHGSLQAETRSHRKILGVLSWLRGKTIDQAIETIVSNFNHNQALSIERIIRLFLKNYNIDHLHNLTTELEALYPAYNADPETGFHPELQPPNFLRRLFEHEGLTSLTLDMIFHNSYFNYPIIDDHRMPSSSYVKYRPYSLALALLRPHSYTNMTTIRRHAQMEKDALIFYDRLQGRYQKSIIKPMERLDKFGSLEHMNFYCVIALEPALKKSLLMETFRFDIDEYNLISDSTTQVFSDSFVHESTICLLLVKYIGLETRANPKPQFVEGLLLTMFYYAALSGQLNKQNYKAEHYGKVILKLRPHTEMTNGKTYEPSEEIYRRIVHFIAQLHCALSAFSFINALLNNIFMKPRHEKYLNGTLIFRLTKLLRLNQLNLDTLCHELPVLSDTCRTLKLLVHSQE